MEKLIPISEMAKLFGITRQTLIYYDDVDLFKPVEVNEKGYRYYSMRQIPFLREICFLKSIGVSLKDIIEHFQNRSAEKEMYLLKSQKISVMQEIARLNKVKESIIERIRIYEASVEAENLKLKVPFIRHSPAKRILFKEYIKPINRENLHATLMSLWRDVYKKELVPSSGFGSLFKKEDVLSHQSLAGAGSCLFLPVWNLDYPESIFIPEQECACMYKYGMPYEVDSIEILLAWINNNGYELCGDIVDSCLLDTTFYETQNTLDYCLLEAPIRLKT